MENEATLIVPIPSLVATLLNEERAMGRPLTEEEVTAIKDACPCIVMTPEQAQAVEQSRGYTDIDPEQAWAHWQEARKMFDDLSGPK